MTQPVKTLLERNGYYLDVLENGKYSVSYYENTLKTSDTLSDAEKLFYSKTLSKSASEAIQKFKALRNFLIQECHYSSSNIRMDFTYGYLCLELHDTHEFKLGANMEYQVYFSNGGGHIGTFKTLKEIKGIFGDVSSELYYPDADEDLNNLVNSMNEDWRK